MVIGKLKWFGGKTQTGKINNFGFISAFIDNEISDIYVNRKNIKENIIPILENDLSEGIYLEFTIEEYNNKKQAAKVDLFTLVGIVKWFNYDSGGGYIKCEGRSDIRINSDLYLEKGDILYFGIRYNLKYQNDEAILIQKVDCFINDEKIIKQCISSNNSLICRKIIPQYVQYIKSLSLENKQIESSILNQINQFLDIDLNKYFLQELLEELPDIFLLSSKLRANLHQFSLTSYCNFLDKNISNTLYHNQFRNEILNHLTNANTYESTVYWENISFLRDISQYKGAFWNFAPVQYKKHIITNKFHDFLQLVEDFQNSEYPHDEFISQKWQILYDFDEFDNVLVNLWNKDKSLNEFERDKMMSARAAEKLAVRFYNNLGYQVDDISTHQVTNESQDWLQGDIRLNGVELLDIKNARTTVNSNVYSEFCIPEFKNYRSQEVPIVSVLSPYRPQKFRYIAINPKILGRCTKQEITHLESVFSNTVLKVNVSRESYNQYLPPWIFDYDDKFYAKQTEVINKFRDLPISEIPNWEDLVIMQKTSQSLCLFITAKRPIPENILSELPQWQRSFMKILSQASPGRLKLPYLFLSILKHFLLMLAHHSDDEHYNPLQYKQHFIINNRPLKIYDPLNIINDFCVSLNSIWTYRKEAQLDQYKIFKFNGKGLLQGQRFEGDHLKTLLAYCGGLIDKKGKCGFTPLVIGKHETCQECGRLICEKCGYCSSSCRSYHRRHSSFS